jgi:hypothetical protein
MSKSFIVQELTIPTTTTALSNRSLLFKGVLLSPATCDIVVSATNNSWVSSGITAGSSFTLPASFAWDIGAGDLLTLKMQSALGHKIQLLGEEVETNPSSRGQAY